MHVKLTLCLSSCGRYICQIFVVINKHSNMAGVKCQFWPAWLTKCFPSEDIFCVKSKSFFWSLVRKTTLNCPNLLFMVLLPALLTCYFLCDIWWRLNYNVGHYYASCNDMTCPRWISWWLLFTKKPENCIRIVFTFIFQTQHKYHPHNCNTQNTSCILLTRKKHVRYIWKQWLCTQFHIKWPCQGLFCISNVYWQAFSIVSGNWVWQADKPSSAQKSNVCIK